VQAFHVVSSAASHRQRAVAGMIVVDGRPVLV
jgi:hypothetical protein